MPSLFWNCACLYSCSSKCQLQFPHPCICTVQGNNSTCIWNHHRGKVWWWLLCGCSVYRRITEGVFLFLKQAHLDSSSEKNQACLFKQQGWGSMLKITINLMWNFFSRIQTFVPQFCKYWSFHTIWEVVEKECSQFYAHLQRSRIICKL